jgi:hypothetical protein
MPNNKQEINTEHKKVLCIDNFDKMTLEEQLELIDIIFKKRSENLQNTIINAMSQLKTNNQK